MDFPIHNKQKVFVLNTFEYSEQYKKKSFDILVYIFLSQVLKLSGLSSHQEPDKWSSNLSQTLSCLYQAHNLTYYELDG